MLSCGTAGKTEQSNCSQKELTFLTDFKIIAYSGPPQEEVTFQRYQEIADAGIEYLVPGNGAFNGETNLKAMDMGLKVGIKIIPIDMRLMPFTLKKVSSIDTSAIKAIVNDYKDHPALAAYLVRDEPAGDLFLGLSEITKVFLAEDSLHEPVINLLPSYGSPIQLGFDDYRSYVISFIKTVKPRLLFYDYYPFRVGSAEYI